MQRAADLRGTNPTRPRKSKAADRRGHAPVAMLNDASIDDQGFPFWVDLMRGLSPSEENAFERRFFEYRDARSLLIDGGPLHGLLTHRERSLTATDQVDWLLWMLDDPLVEAASVGCLLSTAMPRRAQRKTDPILLVPRRAHLPPVVAWLYRRHRIDARRFIDLLGGFTTRADDPDTSPVWRDV